MGDISIDTIKFCIVFTENIEDLFFSIFPKDYSGVKWDRNTQKDISSRFRFFLTDNFNQSSYSSDISFSCIRNRLTFEFSLPKFLWGHNLNLCWNFDYVLNEFRFYLESKLNISVPLIIHWVIS